MSVLFPLRNTGRTMWWPASKMAPIDPYLLVFTPFSYPSHFGVGLVYVISRIWQKWGYVTPEIRLSGVTHSEGSHVMGSPTERPTNEELEPPSGIHMGELGKESSSPSQVFRDNSPGCSLTMTHSAKRLLDTWLPETVWNYNCLLFSLLNLGSNLVHGRLDMAATPSRLSS